MPLQSAAAVLEVLVAGGALAGGDCDSSVLMYRMAGVAGQAYRCDAGQHLSFRASPVGLEPSRGVVKSGRGGVDKFTPKGWLVVPAVDPHPKVAYRRLCPVPSFSLFWTTTTPHGHTPTHTGNRSRSANSCVVQSHPPYGHDLSSRSRIASAPLQQRRDSTLPCFTLPSFDAAQPSTESQPWITTAIMPVTLEGTTAST